MIKSALTLYPACVSRIELGLPTHYFPILPLRRGFSASGRNYRTQVNEDLALRFINHISEQQCVEFGYMESKDHGEHLNLIKRQLALRNHLHLYLNE